MAGKLVSTAVECLPLILSELRLPTVRRLRPSLAEQSNKEGYERSWPPISVATFIPLTRSM